MRHYLVIAVDVTDLTPDEVHALGGEMVVQAEKNEDHIEAGPCWAADVYGEIDSDDRLEGVLNVGLSN